MKRKLDMKKLILIAIAILGTATLKAQQLEQWTQFYLNEYMVNPSVAGLDKYFHANALYRDQWVGISDSPRTYYLSVHGAIIPGKMGIGGSIFSDVVGPTRRNGFQAAYAYHLKVTDAYTLSFTLSTGVLQYAVDGGKIDLGQDNDISISNGFMQLMTLDFGSGLRFAGEHFHVGFYVPQIAGLKAQFFDGYSETQNVLARHYYFNAGYRYDFTDDWAVDANFLGRYVSPVDMMDVQVRGLFRDMVWLGASYRTPLITDQAPSAIGFMTGYQFENNLNIGYAFDLPVGSIATAATGTHEIILGIRFTKANSARVIPADEL
jgi:type IX secretion system PorP/SprF family membrane protein